jgi:integrase
MAVFRTPEGRRVQRETHQSRLAQALEAARTMIEKEFQPKTEPEEKVGWEKALESLRVHLTTSGNRQDTLESYLKAVRVVRAFFPQAMGPQDITLVMAQTLKRRLMTEPGRHHKPRSPHSVKSTLRNLSSLWHKWFQKGLQIVTQNPWAQVKPPKVDKVKVRFATNELMDRLYSWLVKEYGPWEFPHIFLATKAWTACRLRDLCHLKSEQLIGNRLIFPADLVKGREERRLPMPEELYAALEKYKGPTWLWENYVKELGLILQRRGGPAAATFKEEFDPMRLYNWIGQLFERFNRDVPGAHLTSHMFRKRAFTLAWRAGIDMRQAAIAYACHVETLMKHYVDLDKQQITDQVFERMHPNTSPTNGCSLGPGEAQNRLNGPKDTTSQDGTK